jgi:nitrite reductase/ring-hydroxylating ferredoxin subunit
MDIRFNLFKRTGLLLGVMMILTVACKETKSSIPVRSVSLTLNLVGEDVALKSIGAYKTYTTASTGLEVLGYGGILVVHAYDDSYYAFDLACPYEVNDTIRVAVQSDLSAKCPQCGSRYRITDGSGWRIEGPSDEKLKQYHVYPSGNYLYVTY